MDLAATSIHASANQRDHSTLPARDHPVCRRAQSCQGAAWKRRSAPLWRSDGPALTASARAGVGNLRSGRKKACGAVEQKKEPQARNQESKSARKKALAFVAAIRERRNGPAVEPRNKRQRSLRLPLDLEPTRPGRPPLPNRPGQITP